MAREILIYSYAKRNILGKVVLFSTDLNPEVLANEIRIDTRTKEVEANYRLPHQSDVMSAHQIDMALREGKAKSK